MQDQVPALGPIRFGPFELDPRSGQLRNGLNRQLLADQPLALLSALLERPGELVTREELRRRLWPHGTFVDFDHGLNSAVNRLREALSDSAEAPRFVETIPRRGYRFLVPVEVAPSTASAGAAHSTSTAGSVPSAADPDDRLAPGPADERASTTSQVTRNRPRWVAWTVPGIVVLALAGLMWRGRAVTPAPLVANVVIELPEGWRILNSRPAISPDSRHIAFSALDSTGRLAIWLRPLDATAARILPHTEGGSTPFWSPDGRRIGYSAQGKLKVLHLAEGSARVVCDAQDGSGGTWVSSSVVLFAPGPGGGVTEVNVDTGESRTITRLDQTAGDLRHLWPMALPDGRHFVYAARREGTSVGMLGSLEGAEPVALGPVQSHVQPTASGHVLFVRDGILLGQRLDVAAGRLTGEPTILADRLTLPGRFFDGRFSASRAMLVYLTATLLPASELAIFDRSGARVGTVGEAAQYAHPSLSPDGTRLAVAKSGPMGPARDIWVFDLARGSRSRLTLDDADEVGPKWSSDGRWLMFSSDRRGRRDLYKRLASGEGADELVLESPIDKSMSAWSPDGRFVVYDTGAANGTSWPDLHVVDLAGDGRPRVLAAQPGVQFQANISPDGRLIAYASSESGRYEVVVETFPEPGGRWQISTAGGSNPSWRNDGRELYFAEADTVTAVDIRRNAAGLEWSAPRPLFTIPGFEAGPRGLTVSADGRQFIAVVAAAPPAPQRLTTVLNWTALLR
jgi:Tol biopolymer transport system component/DNA-binding winged helix-turn-helix (wHTH) protein